ncbi:MAG: hypothetical protein RI883_1883 [Bacteroidota bacterium]|jgi:uncharacterized protein (DUF1697 family)
MITYISILRGINVGGHRLIKMVDLKSLVTNLGFRNVQTYIQSGNIVFQFTETSEEILEEMIRSAIKKQYDFDVPVMVKGIAEMKDIAAKNPYLKDDSKDISHLHVTFLDGIPNQEKYDTLATGDFKSDEYTLVGKNIYVYCPNGYGNTKLTNTFFENKLKVGATTRNWKTTNELLVMAEKIKIS